LTISDQSERIDLSIPLWACGAVGSALPWHGRGRRFDPDQVHHLFNHLQPLVSRLVSDGVKLFDRFHNLVSHELRADWRALSPAHPPASPACKRRSWSRHDWCRRMPCPLLTVPFLWPSVAIVRRITWNVSFGKLIFFWQFLENPFR
jgi:hypothetical protein